MVCPEHKLCFASFLVYSYETHYIIIAKTISQSYYLMECLRQEIYLNGAASLVLFETTDIKQS
jgi:hypothetical protein